MNWKTTWLLLSLAGMLFAFIFLIERHARPTFASGAPAPRLLNLRRAEVSSIQLRRTNQFLLRADRTNQTWNLTSPLFYPAQPVAIEGLLQTLENLDTHAGLSLDDIKGRGRTIADYGLDVPRATLSLQYAGQRTEILFGGKTPVGDQVYVQLLTAPNIYLAAGEVFDRLPRTADDWRDTALLNLEGLAVDRVEVRSAARGFAIQFDATNNAVYLSKPTPARADRGKVEALLRKLQATRVIEFVTDNPRADLEPYGLQAPEAEVVFGQGTNDLIEVQFGKSPSNDLSLVYARRLNQTNIVLVPKAILQALQTSHTELRDRRLLSFASVAVDRIEFQGEESFAIRRQTNGSWTMEGADTQLADAGTVRELLDFLSRLEGSVEKDVVTDFASYGLAPPVRQYSLQNVATNGSGAATNRVVAQLDIGTRQDQKVFARRAGENSVYAIPPGDYEQLPARAWQLRDRRVWAFTTNQISRVAIRDRGYTRELVRTGPGEWALAPGSSGMVNPLAVEETMFRLGLLRAMLWVDAGETNKSRYGFDEASHQITIELKNGDKLQPLVLEFGARPEGLLPFALARVEGQTWIFKFPGPLFFEVIRDLSNPPKK